MGLKVCQLCAVDFTLKHFLLPLIDGMESEGWQVTSVCSDGEYVREMKQKGYQIKTIEISRSFNVFKHLVSLWRLIVFFRQERFDIVHTHTPIAALVARIAAFLARVPLVVYTAHGFYFHDEMPSLKRKLFVMLERVGGWFTDLLFTQSAEDANAAVVEKIASSEHVVAIGNGVDVERFSVDALGAPEDIKKSLGIPTGAAVVGIIGRMVKEKGYEEFLGAAQILSKDFPNAYFLVVGGRLDSDHNGAIDKILLQAQRALGDRLILAGFRSDIPDLLGVMDVFCLPSYREGMPRTIIEAMMVAKPVVATNVRGAREEVLNEETGLLVPVRSTTALADGLRRMLTDSSWAQQLGLAGRLRALEHYDERKIVQRQLDVISKYAEGRGLIADAC